MLFARKLLAVSVAAVLTACGGGGGGGSSVGGATAPVAAVNQAPISNAGAAQNAVVGVIVTLDGTASTDPEKSALTYKWTLTSKPSGTVEYFSNTTTSKPVLAVVAAGTYVATLVVNDGSLDSAPSTVTINASALTGSAAGRAPIQAEIDYLIKTATENIPQWLKSPSTFKIVGTPTWAYYDTIGKPYEGAVTVNFDSQNGFGALIRNQAICPANFDVRGFWRNTLQSSLALCVFI